METIHDFWGWQRHSADETRWEETYFRSAFDVPTEIGGENPLLTCKQGNHATIDVMHWRENANARRPKSNEPTPQRPFCDFGGHIGLPDGPAVRVSACTECRCLQGGDGSGVCVTVRVKSCEELYADVGEDAVAVDASCWQQCRPTPWYSGITEQSDAVIDWKRTWILFID